MTPPFSLETPESEQDQHTSIAAKVVLAEYHQVFKRADAHFPEVGLRYLIWLIISDSPQDKIKGFAHQMRLELNNAKLHRIKDTYAQRINEDGII